MKPTVALLALNAFNILDGLLTLRAVNGGAVEVNPIMAALVGVATVFMAVKVGMVFAGSVVVYWYEVNWALYAGALLFGFAVAWNLAGLVAGP